MSQRLTTAAGLSFCPERALQALEILSTGGPLAEQAMQDSSVHFLADLANLLVVSPPMLDSLVRHPDWISWLCERVEPGGEATPSYEGEWRRIVPGGRSGELDDLRAFKRREYLDIAFRDVAGLWPLERTVGQLSSLADCIVAAALSLCLRTLESDLPSKLSTRNIGDGFAVFAMGKLGAEELNYSSDVDLLFVRRESEDEEELRFLTRLGEKLIQSLSQPGPDGFLFRVDMRLRPYGETGPLVPSLPSIINYYESWGEAWERQALIKIRHIAGSPELGQRLMDFAGPFTFARQMDDSSLEEIKRVKHRSEKEYARAGEVHIKQGSGGIRDVEFYVQYLQLVAGSHRREVCVRSTLEAIDRLGAARLLLDGEESLLSLAYRFLRIVEHRLQLRTLTPQALVPDGKEDLELLARGIGFPGQRPGAARRFQSALTGYRRRVRAVLERVYLAPGYLHLREREEALARILSDRAPRDQVREILSQYGFGDIEKAWQNLRLLALGPAGRILPPGERRAFLSFAFTVLEVVKDSLDPDLALHNLESFASASGNRVSFLRALASRRSHLFRLSNLLAHSNLCHRILTRHPEFFDVLARGSYLLENRTSKDLLEEFLIRRQNAPDTVNPGEVLRKLRQREMVRIAYRDLSEIVDPLSVSRELSELAEACVHAAVGVAAYPPRGGEETPDEPLVVLALGKLGSRQLNYSSDLDLMFLYGDPPADATAMERAGIQRRQDHRVEEILHCLSAVTVEGIAYPVDLRLRPEGTSGLLARSWSGFLDYVRDYMQPWERMALIRSRVLQIDGKAMAGRWDELISRVVYGFPWDEDSLEAVRHIKRRIEKEKNKESRSHLDFKYGAGGVVDLEFLVQLLQLQHGHSSPSLRTPDLAGAIAALGEIGFLQKEEARQLLEAHAFQRLVENRYQLMEEWTSREISRESPQLIRLARSLGSSSRRDPHETRNEFLGVWNRHAGNVRSLVEKYFYGGHPEEETHES